MIKFTMRRVFYRKDLQSFQFDMKADKNDKNPIVHGHCYFISSDISKWSFGFKLLNEFGRYNVEHYDNKIFKTLKEAKDGFKKFIEMNYWSEK